MYKIYIHNTIIRSSNGYTYIYQTCGNNGDTSANFTKMQFSFDSGANFSGGHIRVFGIKN